VTSAFESLVLPDLCAPKWLSGLALGFHEIGTKVSDFASSEQSQRSAGMQMATPFKNDAPGAGKRHYDARRHKMGRSEVESRAGRDAMTTICQSA
jgi:hypothetical protein